MHLSVTLSTLAFATANANSILYMGSTESASFDTAQSRCASFGGQLATFGSAGEFEALLNVRDGLGGVSAWIGLEDRGTEGHWGFIDGDTSFCQGTGTGLDCDDLPQWAPGEPNNSGDEDCAQLWSTSINDVGCGDSMAFVCEFNGDNYAAIEEGGAIYVARGDDYVDYATAKARCAGFGGQLATFSNEAQFEAMLSVRNVIGAHSWMGFDDINLEHHWQFVDGDLSFCQPQGAGTDCDDIDQWGSGEPNSYQGTDQDCGRLGASSIDDAACHILSTYVCEFEADSFAFTTEIPVIDDDVCAMCECECDGQASYFVFEVTGLEGSGTLMLFSAMMLCIVCLSCLLCKNYQSAHARGKGYGKVVMDTDSEL